MKVVKIILSIVIFIAFCLISMRLLSDNKWPMAIPFILIWSVAVALLLHRKRECPVCKTKSSSTGVSGSSFKQYWCKKCENTFWLDNIDL